ncbi:RDD family protein [Glycomyces salinus]|uniref:RDD family protein n=1 Tax=Glycomyces salinus TaxID=980294 RepID=UPI0018EDF5C1|nr:RDD family protein [Glycomyces salinus]
MTEQLPPPLSSYSLRIVARLVDGIAVLGLIALLGCVLSIPAVLANSEAESDSFGSVAFIGVLVGLVVGVPLYEAGLTAGGRTTAGKWAMKIRVVRIDDGGPLPFGRALARTVVYWMLWLTVIGFWLNAMYVLADRTNRRGIHDLVAGSVVVYTEDVPDARRAVFGAPGGPGRDGRRRRGR